MGFIIDVIGGAASSLLGDGIGNMFRPKEPTALDIFFDLLPQIIGLIIVICLVLSYIGIIKKYKIKIGLLLYPIGFTLLYCIALNIATLFNGFVVIAWALALFVTIIYIRDAISIYNGTKKFKSITQVLNKTATILEKDVNAEKKEK